MPWIIIATAGVFVLANFPLFFAISRFKGADFAFLWKFSPHQFFFSLICVPLAVYLTCCALWWALRALSRASSAAPEPWGAVSANWPVVFLGAICFASIIAAVFFTSTTWSPDKLRDPYAPEAADVVSQINTDYQSANAAERTALDEQKATASNDVVAMELTSSTIDSQFSALRPYEKAQVVLSKDGQTRFGMTDGVATALSAFQVMAVVGVAAVLLVTALVVLFLGRQGPTVAPVAEMATARTALFCAICCFVPYPYLFGMYRSELERVVQSPNTGGQEIVAIFFIVIALGLVTFSDPNATLASAETVRTGVLGVIAIFGLVSNRVDGLGLMRQFIGLQSSLAAQVSLLLGALVLAGIAVALTLPRV